MDDRPNVTVVYQQAPKSGASFGAVLLELLTFIALALVIGGSCGGFR